MNKHLAYYERIRTLRAKGRTYAEINQSLGTKISKSSLNHICKDIVLNEKQTARINQITKDNLAAGRKKALIANKLIFDRKLATYRKDNQHLWKFMKDRRAQLIALAMLYLGEGGKWKSHRGLSLGSSDPVILEIYINLLESCFGITKDKMRGRIQYRADQDYGKIITHWSKVTGINKRNFYPGYVDKRTIGKPTLKPNYRGVCVITCGGTAVQLELEQIVDIINESIAGI